MATAPTKCQGNKAKSLMRLVAVGCLLQIAPVNATENAASGTSPCRAYTAQGAVRIYSRCETDTTAPRPPAGTTEDNAPRRFLNQHAQDLGLLRPAEELKQIDLKRGLKSRHTQFQQYYLGYPIFQAYVTARQNAAGRVDNITSRYAKKREVSGGTTPLIDADQADQLARAALEKLAGKPVVTLAGVIRQVVWLPDEQGRLRLVWEVIMSIADPAGDYRTLLDATDGTILLQEDFSAHWESGAAYVYWPNPIQTSGVTSLRDENDQTPADPAHPLNAQRLAVALLGLTPGVGVLTGQYADMISLDSTYFPPPPNADEPTRQYFYDRTNPRFEQVNAYHAVDAVQRYLQHLGFVPETGNGIHGFPIAVQAHWDNQDASRFSSFLDALEFGDGGVDDAEDADIVIHEYGHALQHDQNPQCWPGLTSDKEMRAMGEGFGDYLAASISLRNHPDDLDGAACIGEWDSTSYSSSGCLRRVDTDKRYEDYDPTATKPHGNGQIWSRALWDLRVALGADTADRLIFEHHFAVPCGATMPMAAQILVDTDTSINKGAHENLLRKTFCERGLFSGAGCLDTDGDGILDSVDNCRLVTNPRQIDTDKDGYGNRCDADFDQSGVVNVFDLAKFRKNFGTTNALYDLNSDGQVNVFDLAIFRSLFGKTPGPGKLP